MELGASAYAFTVVMDLDNGDSADGAKVQGVAEYGVSQQKWYFRENHWMDKGRSSYQ